MEQTRTTAETTKKQRRSEDEAPGDHVMIPRPHNNKLTMSGVYYWVGGRGLSRERHCKTKLTIGNYTVHQRSILKKPLLKKETRKGQGGGRKGEEKG